MPAPDVKAETDRPARPIVPRRKIRARVRLADGEILEGDLYAAVAGRSGESATLADRLNDLEERFLPMACGERHVLLKKSGIVTVEIGRDEAESETWIGPGFREFRVVLALAAGGSVEGVLRGVAEPGHARTLDHLNAIGRGFVAVFAPRGMFLVHTDHVVAVREVIED